VTGIIDARDLTVLFDALGRPFPFAELDWKIQTSPRDANGSATIVPFITARTAMVRLDDAVGPGAWESRMIPLPEHGLICEITLRIANGDGELALTRSDVGAWTVGARSSIDHVAVKGAASDAFKRAAVHFRVGRYLYVLPRLFLPAADLVTDGQGFRMPWPGTKERDALTQSLFDRLPAWANPSSGDPVPADAATNEPDDDGPPQDHVVEATGEINAIGRPPQPAKAEAPSPTSEPGAYTLDTDGAAVKGKPAQIGSIILEWRDAFEAAALSSQGEVERIDAAFRDAWSYHDAVWQGVGPKREAAHRQHGMEPVKRLVRYSPGAERT
tara:strand:+ start:580 stop:1563 length:984 start_codon:yes stop_codon:yes gene_type:complete